MYNIILKNYLYDFFFSILFFGLTTILVLDV
jgi:hypothetical protein